MRLTNPPIRPALSGLLLTLTLAGAAAGQSFRAAVATSWGTDQFAVVLSDSGQRYGVNIKLEPVGYDECGRTFYLDGMLLRDQSMQGGTFSGKMTRCTTRELKDACAALGKTIDPNYQVDATGTFKYESTGLILTLAYEGQTWNKTDCKLTRPQRGTDVAIITQVTPGGSRNPWPVTYEDLRRGVTYGAGGPSHPMNR